MPVPLFLIWFAQVVFSSHQAKQQQQAQPEVWTGDGFEREALISADFPNVQQRCTTICISRGFPGYQELSCSLLAPSAHSSPQNLLTCHAIYHLDDGFAATSEAADGGEGLEQDKPFQGRFPAIGPLGNLTLWLKNCGPHDRKSTESSNLSFLTPSLSAPHLYLSTAIM
jgi:hypothetical protein